MFGFGIGVFGVGYRPFTAPLCPTRSAPTARPLCWCCIKLGSP